MRESVARKNPFEHSRILGAESAAAVDNQDQTDQRFADVEIVLHELQPMQPDPLGHLRETIARQVDQAALGRKLEEIDELRTSRSAAHRARPMR